MKRSKRDLVFLRWRRLPGAALALLVSAAPAAAVDCTVPGTHPSLHQAVADPACSRILLADQIYPDSVMIARSLEIVGATTGVSDLHGSLEASNGAQIQISDLHVGGCSDAAVRSSGGAEIDGMRLAVETGTGALCPLLFADGFESGDTSAWSGGVP